MHSERPFVVPSFQIDLHSLHLCKDERRRSLCIHHVWCNGAMWNDARSFTTIRGRSRRRDSRDNETVLLDVARNRCSPCPQALAALFHRVLALSVLSSSVVYAHQYSDCDYVPQRHALESAGARPVYRTAHVSLLQAS